MAKKERTKSSVVRQWSVILAKRLAFMAFVLAVMTIFVRHRPLVDQALRWLVAAFR
jgi:hypothetical protein